MRPRLTRIGLALLATAAYAVYSLERHARFMSMTYDLGIYNHVAWEWSQFRLPDNPIQSFSSELGDHFSPIYALFAPGYWIHSGAEVGLVGQAILIGISVPAVHRAVMRRTGEWPALAITLGYVLYWGVWAAVDFDFHETAFAAPLLAWAIDCADLRRWGRCAVLLGALVLTKEDMGLVIACFGLWLLATGARRQGAIAIAAGAVAFVVVNQVVMPAFNDGEVSTSNTRVFAQYGGTPFDAAVHLLTHPVETARLIVEPSAKIHLILVTYGAFLFLALLSPLALITIPQLLERMISPDFHLWAPEYHYTLTIAPVIAIAAGDGLSRLQRWLGGRTAGSAVVAGLAGGIVLLAVGSAATQEPRELFKSSFYERNAQTRDRAAAVAAIPDGAAVAASRFLLPHLSARRRIYSVEETGLENADWAVVERSGRPRPIPGWRVVSQHGGAVVYRRAAPRSP